MGKKRRDGDAVACDDFKKSTTEEFETAKLSADDELERVDVRLKVCVCVCVCVCVRACVRACVFKCAR